MRNLCNLVYNSCFNRARQKLCQHFSSIPIFGSRVLWLLYGEVILANLAYHQASTRALVSTAVAAIWRKESLSLSVRIVICSAAEVNHPEASTGSASMTNPYDQRKKEAQRCIYFLVIVFEAHPDIH